MGGGGRRDRDLSPTEEQISPPGLILLSDQEIANLSDAQFKTLVIRKLTELIDFGCKLDEEMQVAIKEMKEDAQRANSDGKETGSQNNRVNQKEAKNNQAGNHDEIRIQKNEEKLRSLQYIFKHSNIRIIGVPEGEEEEQQAEELFEQITKENFPILAKEIDFQEVQESQRVPRKLDPRGNTPRHIIITLAKVKMKEKNPRSSKR
ncbi:hypothetical protein HJG60_007990 [Phyllostomus discolor]|uniref:L1 transposable element RRM domain-containing protein n=1 Tax=Phyllostomus discolor TaxID=89673 RepID=A0A834EVV4_9CHIR|nr:hypothetical protein HJG60_007990 [Phyllostomus discolor]